MLKHLKYPSCGAMLVAIATLVPSCAVMAQTKTEPVLGDPCTSQLGQQQPGEKGEDTAKPETADRPATGERLAKCGDVLKPPDTGDKGLVKPAPEKGSMPVIRPKTVPPQQESDPDAD